MNTPVATANPMAAVLAGERRAAMRAAFPSSLLGAPSSRRVARRETRRGRARWPPPRLGSSGLPGRPCARSGGGADQRDARHDRDDPADRDRPRPLAEERDARHRGQQRTGAPADRVHQRQVTQPVAGLQEHEVGRLQHAGAGHEHPAQRGEVQPAAGPGDGDHGDVQQRGRGGREPDEGDRPGLRGLLAEQVPAGVRDGGDENERDCGGTHGRRLLPVLCPGPGTASRALEASVP